MNIFQNKSIIQILGESCSVSDKKTLKKLRRLSTSYYNTLRKPYFDLLQIQLSVDMHEKKQRYSFPSGSEYGIQLEAWKPIMAQRIRVLELKVTGNEEYFEVNPSSVENMDMYHVLFKQIFPYVTTLKLLSLPKNLDTTKLLQFIQQFPNLKNISLQICAVEEGEESYYNEFKSVLSTLKSFGLIVELRLLSFEPVDIEDYILDPEKGIKNVIHRIGFDIPVMDIEEDLEQLAQIVTENESIISNITLSLEDLELEEVNRDNPEIILKPLRVISPFISSFEWIWIENNEFECTFDIFSSISWPNLNTLDLKSYASQLPDLSFSCPKLQSLVATYSEDVVFFSDTGKTRKKALRDIFGGCVKSLKKCNIQIKHDLQTFFPKLLPRTQVTLRISPHM